MLQNNVETWNTKSVDILLTVPLQVEQSWESFLVRLQSRWRFYWRRRISRGHRVWKRFRRKRRDSEQKYLKEIKKPPNRNRHKFYVYLQTIVYVIQTIIIEIKKSQNVYVVDIKFHLLLSKIRLELVLPIVCKRFRSPRRTKWQRRSPTRHRTRGPATVWTWSSREPPTTSASNARPAQLQKLTWNIFLDILKILNLILNQLFIFIEF